MSDPPTFTRQQLHEELVRFRELMGLLSFWKRPNHQEALKGLTHLFLATPDATDGDTAIYHATIEEYKRRSRMAPEAIRRAEAEENANG